MCDWSARSGTNLLLLSVVTASVATSCFCLLLLPSAVLYSYCLLLLSVGIMFCWCPLLLPVVVVCLPLLAVVTCCHYLLLVSVVTTCWWFQVGLWPSLGRCNTLVPLKPLGDLSLNIIMDLFLNVCIFSLLCWRYLVICCVYSILYLILSLFPTVIFLESISTL